MRIRRIVPEFMNLSNSQNYIWKVKRILQIKDGFQLISIAVLISVEGSYWVW